MGLPVAAPAHAANVQSQAHLMTSLAPEPSSVLRFDLAIQRDHLLCLVCGKPQKVLKRHLGVRHDLTPAQYRERFGLKPDYPMAAPSYVQRRREVALQTGLGRLKKPARRPRKKSTAKSSPA